MNDKLADIREVWEHFVVNCKRCYNPSDTLTIDEQLVAFCGRCTMKQYMKSKPARYLTCIIYKFILGSFQEVLQKRI